MNWIVILNCKLFIEFELRWQIEKCYMGVRWQRPKWSNIYIIGTDNLTYVKVGICQFLSKKTYEKWHFNNFEVTVTVIYRKWQKLIWISVIKMALSAINVERNTKQILKLKTQWKWYVSTWQVSQFSYESDTS